MSISRAKGLKRHVASLCKNGSEFSVSVKFRPHSD